MFSSFSKEYNEIWNNNKKTKSYNINTKINKNNIIYSNELVKDLKILKRCNSLESIDYNINRINNEINIRLGLDNRYSIENMIPYLSLEESPKDKESMFKKIKKGVKFIIDKVLSLGFSIGMKIIKIIKEIQFRYQSKIYKIYDETKVKNIDREITLSKNYKLPLNFDILTTSLGDYGVKIVNLLSNTYNELVELEEKDMSYRKGDTQDVEKAKQTYAEMTEKVKEYKDIIVDNFVKDLNKSFYVSNNINSEDKNFEQIFIKKEPTTYKIKDFLNINQEGERTKLIEIFSPESISKLYNNNDKFKKQQKYFNENIKKILNYWGDEADRHLNDEFYDEESTFSTYPIMIYKFVKEYANAIGFLYRLSSVYYTMLFMVYNDIYKVLKMSITPSENSK